MEKKKKLEKVKCSTCDYATSHSGALKNHILAIHDRVKKFKCELCEYAASVAGVN